MAYFILFCLLSFLFVGGCLDYRDDIRRGQAEYDRERIREEKMQAEYEKSMGESK